MTPDVEHHLGCRMIVGGRESLTLPSTWRYYKSDPLAVEVEFMAEHEVPWTFARQLLVEALVDGEAGQMDVIVKADKYHVTLRLSGATGTASLRFERSDIEEFVAETIVAVGYGHEQVDVDGFIEQLRKDEDWWL